MKTNRSLANAAIKQWKASQENFANAIEQEAMAGTPAISNIVIGTHVKIINPDDTADYGVELGDKGVVVWVSDSGTVFGVCIPVKGDVWSFESYQLEVIANEAVTKASATINHSDSLILNCNQLKNALEFGAPVLFQETKGQSGDIKFQLETEMTIGFSHDGHSGSGYYCWYTDLPEEGSIFLSAELEAQEQPDAQ